MPATERSDEGRREDAPACSWTEDLPGLVLGTLAVARRQRLEQHLAGGCQECRGELGGLLDVGAELEGLHGSEEPPIALRERVIALTHDVPETPGADEASAETVQVWRAWTAGTASGPARGLSTIAASEEEWQPLAVPGVRVRQLSVDEARDSVTMLVQMDPGSSYPPHRHAGVEECFVLAGDLEVAGETLGAGDYQRAEAGSLHGVQSTRGGCRLLIVSSLHDELT